MAKVGLFALCVVVCLSAGFAGAAEFLADEEAVCQASWNAQIDPKQGPTVTSSGLPACPTASPTCVGGNNTRRCHTGDFCKAGSTIQVVDTGNTQCDDNGTIVTCGAGETIQIKKIPCTQCPCCSQQPACFCPLDCGEIRSWGCN